MRFVILHYHIFKNAGSTVEDILDHSFGDRFGMLETSADGGLISNPDLIRYLDDRPGLCALSSHQIRYPLPVTPGYLFFDICFLRDPLDRLRSFYDYFRQRPNPDDPMSTLANRCEPGDFVAGMIADHSLFVRNNQVNLLACGGDSDEPSESDLELATQRMLGASFVGVVDCFEQSAAAGCDALRCVFPELDCARPPVNVSGGMRGTVASRTEALRGACRPELFEELLRITALDRLLVDRARAEVLRRAQLVRVKTTRPKRAPSRVWSPPEFHSGPITIAKRLVRLAPFWRELFGSGRAILCDASYYRSSFLHFLLEGAYEGRSPHALFDAGFYLRKYPDVAVAGVNPLLHYLKYGRAEGRRPHALFDPVFYLDRNEDVRRAEIDPLLHYIRNGAAEDRKPHQLFEPAYYRAACRERCGESPANPLVHFLSCGAEAANPHPLFDCEAYLAAHPEVEDNPLVHYLESGGAAGGGGLEILDVRLNGEPQQEPFLRVASGDQIRAQMR